MKNVIDKLLWEEGFYPFSDKYALKEAVRRTKEKYGSYILDNTADAILKYSPWFNQYHLDVIKQLRKIVKKSKLTKDQFILFILAIVNRGELIVEYDVKEQYINSSSSLDFDRIPNTYITKDEFQNKNESSWGLIDAIIDVGITNLNYSNYLKFPKEETPIDKEIDQVTMVRNLTIIGSAFNTIKDAYDKVIWQYGTMEFEEEKNRLILLQEETNLKLKNIGLTRLTRNSMNNYFDMINNVDDYKDYLSFYHKTRRFQILKSIKYVNDEIEIQYTGKGRIYSNEFCHHMASIITYYPFFRTKEIDAFQGLTIQDLVNLFSNLAELADNLPFPDYNDTDIVDFEKFQKFAPRIKLENLIKYYVITTKYKRSQIELFLNLLIQNGKDHNLYLYPLYKMDDYIVFSVPNIKRANKFYLVDKWLEAGGCDLSERGYEFEDYIKKFLTTEKMNEYAKFKLIENSNFSFIEINGEKKEEEIDIVILTNSSLILGEIKCITYPLESKDYYQVFHTLKKAKNQIQRKSKFIKDNWNQFADTFKSTSPLKIETIIVTNFPHFTGTKIDGIPVADFYLFFSYFKTGLFTQLKVIPKEGIIKHEEPYYTDEASFISNFSSFFENPIPIQELMVRQSIEEYEVSIQGTEPSIFSTRVRLAPKEKIFTTNL
jgi:hypothetical protein